MAKWPCIDAFSSCLKQLFYGGELLLDLRESFLHVGQIGIPEGLVMQFATGIGCSNPLQNGFKLVVTAKDKASPEHDTDTSHHIAACIVLCIACRADKCVCVRAAHHLPEATAARLSERRDSNGSPLKATVAFTISRIIASYSYCSDLELSCSASITKRVDSRRPRSSKGVRPWTLQCLPAGMRLAGRISKVCS